MDDPGPWCLPLALICVALSAFFSTLSLVLRHINWAKLDQAFTARQQSHRSQIIRRRRPQIGYSIATLRLLSNLALVLLVAYYFIQTGPNAPHAVSGPLLKAFMVSSAVLIIFSVALPYAWAHAAPAALIVYSYPVLRLLGGIMAPVAAFLQLFDPLFRSLVGASPEHPDDRLEEKQEELLSVVEEGQKEGVVDEMEREMIESVLEFRATTAGEIMTPRTDIIAIKADAQLTEAIEIIITEGHSRYPVYENSIDNITGMLYAKDLLPDLINPQNARGLEPRLRQPFFVPENKTLRDLLTCFQNQKIHIAVVLDEYGGTAGIVTIEDILEELVGEIIDEHEPPEPDPLIKINDRTLEVDARYEVDKLNYECRLNLPEDQDYESIGGFVVGKLGYIPPVGFTFEHQNLHFTVLEAGPRKIERLRIVIASAENEKPEKEQNDRP